VSNLHDLETSNFHLHLTGALYVEDVRELGTAEDVPCPEETAWENFDCPDVWSAAKELTSTPAGLRRAIGRVVVREAGAHTEYVELTLNPFGMIRRGMTPDSIAETLASVESSHPRPRLKIKFGVNRKDGPASIAAVAASYAACPPELRAGIDLNGDEQQFPTADFVEGFCKLARAGIMTTLHAGEFPGMTDSLRDALRAEPSRIGHAVAAGDSPALLRQLATREITVECAPTSNRVRNVVRSMAEHPIRRFIDEGVPVVFGTDDPGFFRNAMTDELAVLRQAGLSDADITELNALANQQRLA